MRWLTAAVAVLALASPAGARVAGGGPAATDCYAEFDGPGITATKGTRVECTDGDPACDADGTCDGTCDFLVQVCANQCATPKTVERIEKVKGAALELPPLPATEPACGGLVTVTTRKPKGKKPKPGKAKVGLAAFASGGGKADRDKMTLVCKPRTDTCPPPVRRALIDIPPFLVDPPRPPGGTEVIVTLDAPADAVTSLEVNGDGCGTLVSVAGVTGPLTQRATAGVFGSCDLGATAARPGEAPKTYEAHFSVIPIDLALPALTVRNGIFLPGALPPQTGSPDDPIIAAVDAPGTLVNGGGAQIRLQLADPAQASTLRSVQVQLDGAGGYGGFFEVPVRLDGAAVVLDLALAADFDSSAFLTAQAEPGTIDANVQLVNQQGRVGNRIKQTFTAQRVTTGPVQVSISWDTDTDVDLHLIEPDGTEIWYGNPTSPSGGTLNVDSNAGCSVDGKRAENITYPTLPPAAPEGSAYVVKVDFWSDCATDTEPGKSAVVTVKIRVCGSSDDTEVRFAAGTSDQGGAGSGDRVASFNTSCRRVRGRAMYEDMIPRPSGLVLSAKTPAIRFAKVKVRNAEDTLTLGVGTTKQDGTFDVPFSNEFEPGYFVQVGTEEDDDLQRQVVIREGGQTYTARSEGIVDETVEPDKENVEVKAKVADGNAAAFNIFDQGVEGAMFIRSRYGTSIPKDKELLWSWIAGQNGACPIGSTCFDETSTARRISVTSLEANPDEWDDSVLLHEFGHLWLKLYSRADRPSVTAHSGSQTLPTLAFNEGAATWFGQTVLYSSLYIDMAPTLRRSSVYSIDDIDPVERPIGTSDGTDTGNVSEDLVSGVLWDLSDHLLQEAGDTVANPDAVFAAFSYLRGPKFHNRGVEGADLVDLLDGWFCLGHDDRGDATTGVEGIVKGLFHFPYDFAALADCR